MEGSTESIKYKAKTIQQEVHLENKIKWGKHQQGNIIKVKRQSWIQSKVKCGKFLIIQAESQ